MATISSGSCKLPDYAYTLPDFNKAEGITKSSAINAQFKNLLRINATETISFFIGGLLFPPLLIAGGVYIYYLRSQAKMRVNEAIAAERLDKIDAFLKKLSKKTISRDQITNIFIKEMKTETIEEANALFPKANFKESHILMILNDIQKFKGVYKKATKYAIFNNQHTWKLIKNEMRAHYDTEYRLIAAHQSTLVKQLKESNKNAKISKPTEKDIAALFDCIITKFLKEDSAFKIADNANFADLINHSKYRENLDRIA